MHCPLCQAPLADDAQFCSGCGAGKAAHAAQAAAKKPGRSTCAVIAAVVAVVGILFIGLCVAIALPGIIFPISHGKQKRTMGDMKTLASAIEQYNTDNHQYPQGNSMDALCKALTPDYLVTCIRKDGWSSASHLQEFRYIAWEESFADCPEKRNAPAVSPQAEKKSGVGSVPRAPAVALKPACIVQHYLIASAGKDGIFQVNDLRGYQPAETTSFDSDIVLRDGKFLRQPTGKQHDGPPD